VINRRQLLRRDPPIRWDEVIENIRRLGYSTGEIAMALNVPRSTLWQWEQGSCPNYEDGRALLKMLDTGGIKIAVITAHIPMMIN
jgi:DNA-binding transcriptional regulator YiaG